MRVNDPSAQDPTSNVSQERYRLNANLLIEDIELLKVIDLNRGLIQNVTSNLIHSFCNVLRTYGITNRTQLDQFHYALAAWSGRYDCTPVEYADPRTGYASFVRATDEIFLPGWDVRRTRGEVCGGAAAQVGGEVSERNDGGGTAGVRGDSKRVSKESADVDGKDETGRGEAGYTTRRARAQKDSQSSKQDGGGKAKETGPKRRGSGRKASE